MLADATAVILAGGFGTRVRHLLPGIPKPMANIAGRPFLEWVVRFLAREGVTRVVLSTGYLAEVIEDHFETNPVPGVDVDYSPEREPLGTAGGFLNAVNASGHRATSWLVLNGDSLCFADLAQAYAQMEAPGVSGCVIGCRVPDASRYGTLQVDPAGDLCGFEEKRSGQGIINAGMYLFRDGIVRQFPRTTPLSFETQVFPALAAQHARLKVYIAEGPFLDIGTPESLQEGEAFITENLGRFA